MHRITIYNQDGEVNGSAVVDRDTVISAPRSKPSRYFIRFTDDIRDLANGQDQTLEERLVEMSKRFATLYAVEATPIPDGIVEE